MSKSSKSRQSGSKKKRSKSRSKASKPRNNVSELKKSIEQKAPEQLNNETQVNETPVVETEVEVKIEEPEPEAPVVSDELIDIESESIPQKELASEETEETEEAEVEQVEELTPQETEEIEKAEVEKTVEHVEETAPQAESKSEVQSIEQNEVQSETKFNVRKKHTGIKVICVLAVLMIYCAAAIYGFFWIDDNIIDPDVYPSGTTINGVDVSNMNIDQAKEALTDDWNKHTISIFNVYGNEIGEIDDFDFEYDIDEQLEHALSPGAEVALLRYFDDDKDDITIKMDPAGNTKSFKDQFSQLSIVKSAKGDKPSKNAYIDKSDTDFRIVKEVIGNSVDTGKLREAIFEAISNGDETFKYRRSDYHQIPEIVSTSELLLKERKYCVKYLSFKIRLRNPVNDYTIPPSWLDKMIKVNDNGKVKVIDEQVSQFISEILYPKFSSVGDTRTLRSVGGGTYTISGGTYGYTVDTEKEHNVLSSELKDRENVEREPYYSGKTPKKNWKNDIGNDFIEVSIAKQTCWVVRHGKTVVDTPVVTGVLPRHATPKGVFYIVYKATNTTLKGRNDDGSKYESHVNYWMPFYLGFGLHDANWRGAFGGSIYINGGSHGCVNCPPSIMPKIFSNSYEGMPVIVH